MGWIFNDQWTTRECVAEHINHSWNKECTLLGNSLVGNTLYQAIETASGEVFIAVSRIKACNREYGYKMMTSVDYPYYYDCPEKILKLSTREDKNTLRWIEKCRQVRKKNNDLKKLFDSLESGDVVRLYDMDAKGYTDLTYVCHHKGQPCFYMVNGSVFRYPKRITQQWENWEVLKKI